MNDADLGDWRIRVVTRLAKDVPAAYPGGPSHKAGTPVYVSSLTRDSKGEYIGFATPHPTAMALNIAHQAGLRAKELRGKLVYGKTVTPYGAGKGIDSKALTTLYDYFEHCMVAIAFSFQAIETYANDAIAHLVKGEYTLQRGSKDINCSTSDELQRVASTEEKIGAILPSVLNLPSPRQSKFWRHFKELKRVRDSTIHLKSTDAYTGGNLDKESLFHQFMRLRAERFPWHAFDIISYYIDKDSPPRWYLNSKRVLSNTPE